MTLDVYGHVVPGQGQRAAAAFADLVEGSGSCPDCCPTPPDRVIVAR
jgi:hypothetical protein